jgi:hypothetical protein
MISCNSLASLRDATAIMTRLEGDKVATKHIGGRSAQTVCLCKARGRKAGRAFDIDIGGE